MYMYFSLYEKYFIGRIIGGRAHMTKSRLFLWSRRLGTRQLVCFRLGLPRLGRALRGRGATRLDGP